MYVLNGKTLIFTDLHCGLAGNRLSRLNICVKTVKEIVAAVKRFGVANIIFGGDWYHSRSTLDVNTINVSLKLVQALSKHAKLYMICGNHDAFLKNSTDVNSLNMFRDTPNVTVFDKPEEILVNSRKCLLVPWLTDLTAYSPETFDLMIGHFEISSKYLIQSYIEEHSAKKAASSDRAASIDSDELLSAASDCRKSNDMIGTFVDLVKKSGTVYAGHIHNRKEFSVRGRRFVFVGSPYQQTLGEMDSDCGFYVLDEKNVPEFVRTETAPRHVKITMSDAVSGKFDFSLVAGNIIQKVYDVDVRAKDEAAVNQRINDFKPYEELTPDYRVTLDGCGQDVDNSSLELIKKSKIEYMRNYIDNIDQAALDEQKLDRDRLFGVLESYYRKVTEN